MGLAVAVLAILTARLFHLPAEPGPALALGLSVLIGSAVRILPPVQAGAVVGGGFAVVAGSGLAVLSASSGGTTVVVLNGLAWLAAVVVGVSLRLLDSRARATAQQVRRAERLELARELHDVVAHHITGMLIQAQAAQVVARKNPGEVMESLADIEVAGSEALVAMRRVVGLLRDTEDAAPVLPRSEEVSTLVERFNRQGRPTVNLHMPDGDTVWPPEVTSTVYGIVQEALTNVLRHAQHARSVTVSVDQEPHGVIVEVVDDAPQAAIRGHHRGGYGLVGMRERVEILGGTLHAGRGPAAGWSVRATLPIPARQR
jgi:signal transduction histidine kinase